METKHAAEYQVGNTLYQVTPVYKGDGKAEDLSDKIKRLILKDKEQKTERP